MGKHCHGALFFSGWSASESPGSLLKKAHFGFRHTPVVQLGSALRFNKLLEVICMHPRGSDIEFKSLNFQVGQNDARILILLLNSYMPLDKFI